MAMSLTSTVISAKAADKLQTQWLVAAFALSCLSPPTSILKQDKQTPKAQLAFMPPAKKLPQSAEEATAANNSLLMDFFKGTMMGRPKGMAHQKKAKHGPVPQLKQPPPVAPSNEDDQRKCAADNPVTLNKKVKTNRTNWAKGYVKVKLDLMVNDFLKKEGTALDENSEALSLRAFSNISGIPYSTMKKYVCVNAEKCHKTGHQVGNAPLLSHVDQHFTADVLVRMD